MTALHSAAIWGADHVAAILLARGADSRATLFDEDVLDGLSTPLLLAAKFGAEGVLDELLHAPHDEDMPGHEPWSPAELFEVSAACIKRHTYRDHQTWPRA
jgi:ankyrin repeat protein